MAVLRFEDLDPNGTYSYADYLTWKFQERVELFMGKIKKMSAPAINHQRISTALMVEVGIYLREKKCEAFAAPFDVRLVKNKGVSEKETMTVVQPDFCVVCDLKKLDKRGCKGAPEWIVEIVSPSSVTTDTVKKFRLYEQNGVQHYWIVFPKEQLIQAFELKEDGTYDDSKVYSADEDDESFIAQISLFPDFELDVREIFKKI